MATNAAAPNINDVLFPVELRPVFVENLKGDLFSNTFRPIHGFCAVIAVDNDYVFSVVAQNYKLVANEEAIRLGEICFEQIFTLINKKDMKLFNIIMPKTRSFCHVDFTYDKGIFSPFTADPWMPYIRITNSYNRMFALNFDLGFCRGICRNGVIFGKKNIEFKFHHNRAGKNPEAEFSLRAGEFANIESQFIESLKNLKRYHVPRKFMWPLTCKVFEYTITETPSERQQQIITGRKERVTLLSHKYFDSLGENGYAALNVLTDFATRPVGVISAEGTIDLLQKKTGEWIIDFVEAIESRDFVFEKYLGDYAGLAA